MTAYLPPTAPLHMGALHPVEQLLVLTVAFGPFLVLFVVVYVVRRRAIEEEAQGGQDGDRDQDRDQQPDRETGS